MPGTLILHDTTNVGIVDEKKFQDPVNDSSLAKEYIISSRENGLI